MVYCSECGYQNNEAANFCAKCGTMLVLEEPAAQTTSSFTPADFASAEEMTPEALERPTLVIRSGAGRAGEHLPLSGQKETIGRSPDANLFLDDITVSREHAVIEREADGVYIRDLESLNGTYVNRHRVGRHRLADGDEVQIGKFKLTYLEG